MSAIIFRRYPARKWRSARCSATVNIYPLAIEAVEKGYISLKAIEPKEFPFEQADEAFQYTITHAQEVIKTLIKVSD